MITLINHQGLKVVKGLQLQTPSPSIGLAYIGAYLKSKGLQYKGIDACGEALDQVYPYLDYEATLVQGLTNREVINRIPLNTKVFGFTCLFSQCWPLVYTMALEIRKHFPESLFVVGGEHPTAMPEAVLNSGIFDCVVYGEGEETFYDIASKFLSNQNWQSAEGIYYLNKNKLVVKNLPRKRITDIDNFPEPDWDSWPIKEYISHNQVTGINLGRSIPILGSRGCPYACTFCSNEDMWTRRYIMRDAKKLVDEMEHMKNKYGVTGFTFMDSTFIVNRRKVMDFAQELIKRNLNIVYQLPAGTRAEAFDQELAFALETSGLRNLALAPESGSVEILKAIKKQVDLDKLLDSARYIVKTKMTLAVFIVIGFPEDNKKTLRQSLSLVRKLALIGAHDVTVSKFTPYPGSPYFHRFVKEGKIMPDYQNVSKMINFYASESESYCDNFTTKQLHRYMLWFFLNFYVLSFLIRPWRVLSNFKDYFERGIENTRYMRMFSELFTHRKKWKTEKKYVTVANVTPFPKLEKENNRKAA